ncbi:MAG TPA: 5'/3'-nucleotidase SurE [Oligoflexia bacterium]|nr:5'/3'-nucleotidase SurE [Oligoflexia bacterium]HMP49006.1 5'/3'-nucleotidase SurE [Oligoflexia bacterium]
MNILVTNDDGFDSPLFQVLVKTLKKKKWVSSVYPVVPSSERSWIAGAVSKHGNRYIRTRLKDETKYLLLEGTPADCTSIGIGNLYPGTIDLVISGINFGSNAGLAFHCSSGTVAGARQAAFFGVQGVALSCALKPEIFNLWKTRDFNSLSNFSDYFNALAEYQVNLTGHLVNIGLFGRNQINKSFNPLKPNQDIPIPDYASLNSPSDFKDEPPVVCNLKSTRFNPIFIKERDYVYSHKFQGFAGDYEEKFDPDNPEDLTAVRSGKHSLTLFNLEAENAIIKADGYCRRLKYYQDLVNLGYSK